MRHCFSGKTADEVWQSAINELLSGASSVQASRLGEVIELQQVSFNIENPRDRWITSRTPAINPAFAIAEVFSILAGSNDAKFVNYWNPALPKYAGNEDQYYGAYGFRLRKHFAVDQIDRAYHVLKSNSSTRQVILQIWDPVSDLPLADGLPRSADIPCNICSLLKVRDGKLDWLQIMRSNDVYRGTPYNLVQFTVLQEIIAGWLSLQVGNYCQVSDSLHLYVNDMRETMINEGYHDAPLKNNDNLSLGRNEWDQVFGKAYSSMKDLASCCLDIKDFKTICNDESLPQSYRNLVLISAADSARRRGWYDEMNLAAGLCSNDLLVTLWDEWKCRKMSIK